MSISSATVGGGKIKYKIVLLGDQHVGKTSIIDRFINNRFENTYNATIGIDFLVRNIVHQGRTYRLQLWDTAGQERFKSMIPSYLKDSNCCILVYDLNCSKSLQNAHKWLDLYNDHKEHQAFCILVGNKADLTEQQCSPKLIQQCSENMGVPSESVSAKTGQGINELFLKAIQQINQKIEESKSILKEERKEMAPIAEETVTIRPIKLRSDEVEVISMKSPCC